MNRSLKRRFTRTPGQMGVELENHFILRLPQPQAGHLRDLLRSNQSSNIKDRLSIQLDCTTDKDDMRNGIITIDTIMYKSRLMDLPTLVESWKTTDGKNFYKTADICQMLMVRDGEDSQEEEDSKKKRSFNPNRVDKKYLYPHGYTPPLKNVRKRRFRKMLRKKILELPEIEKEVKRLLRADEEALNVKWEVLREDEDKGGSSGAGGMADMGHQDHDGGHNVPANLDEQLFGEMVSSSEDEVGPTIIDDDEDSRLSVDDTRFSEPYTQDAQDSPHMSSRQQYLQSQNMGDQYNSRSPPHGSYNSQSGPSQSYVTEFNPSMFQSGADNNSAYHEDGAGGSGSMYHSGGDSMYTDGGQHSTSMFGSGGDGSHMFMGDGIYDRTSAASEESGQAAAVLLSHMGESAAKQESSSLVLGLDTKDRALLQMQLSTLEGDLAELAKERSSHQAHMDSLDNLALKTRFLTKLQDIGAAMRDKEEEVARIRAVLQR